MRNISSFLIAAALIVGMMGCGGNGDNGGNGVNGGDGGNGGESCALTVDTTAGGTVTVNNVTLPGKGTFAYAAGAVVRLNAAPDSGYQFVRWIGDVGTLDDVHASETNITVNGNYSIVAKFEVPQPVRYRLAIFSTGGGSVTTPGEDSFTYYAGTVVSIVATPAGGYKFVKWTGNVTTIVNVNAASTTITMNGDYYICAHFLDIPCTGLG